MPDNSNPPSSMDVIAELVNRFGKPALQVFAGLAGATGLFYAIGFLIVNVSLLRLGVYETALISVGYVVPGIAFAVIVSLSALATIGASNFWQGLLRNAPARRWLIPAGVIATLAAGSVALGWFMWFFRNIAWGVAAWCLALNFVVVLMVYTEQLALVNRLAVKPRLDDKGNPLSPLQARLKSPPFLLTAAGLLFASVLLYGQFAYEQIPPVFGGGLPSVVRFYGANVTELAKIGIDPEPGQQQLTERVQLIAQTEDRYIVRAADLTLSFDKEFVQGIRYEQPEFFLDEAYILESHTRQGERFFADERYDEARSEFDFVLDRKRDYAPALRGRIGIALLDDTLDLDRAYDDYEQLAKVEPQNGENYYGFALVQVRRALAQGQTPDAGQVVATLQSAAAISSTLLERARGDELFNPLRGNAAFDPAVYGSGPDAARWFRARGESLAQANDLDGAIGAYEWAVRYDMQYASDANALSPREAADLHLILSRLYLARDPLSEEAIAELEVAALLAGLSPTDLADVYVALSELYLLRDSMSDKAVEALRSAVEATGAQDARYLIRLAELHRRRGESAEAQDVYALVLQLDTAGAPDRREALLGQGRVALEGGDYEKASAAFEQAIELSPPDASTLYDYARSLAALGDERTAQALRAALGLDSSLADQARDVDWQRYFANAGTAVTSLIDGAVAARRAREAANRGDLNTALAEYQKATGADPGVPGYWSGLGEVLSQSGRYTETVAAYQNALQRMAAPDPALLTALGRAQIASSDVPGAIDSFSRAINAQDASPAETHALLAGAYESARQYAQAADAYAQAALRDPVNDVYPYRQGVNLLLAGRIDQGLVALDRAQKQGGLRVESSAGASLRDTAGAGGALLKTLSVGAVLSISGQPQVADEQVWWPVVDQEGMAGWVTANNVTPSPPPFEQPPVQTAPSVTPP
jgi:Flp pilus assembly protein TadD